MKKFLKPLVFIALAVAVAFAPLARAQAQNNLKPVAVVSLSGLNEVFNDVTALSKWTGTDANAGLFIALARGFTNGLDQKRPAGAYVVMENGQPKVIAFVPVKDLAAFLDMHKEQIGAAKDLGDGVLQLAGNRQPIYVKEQAGWAFVAQDQDHLTNLMKITTYITKIENFPAVMEARGEVFQGELPASTLIVVTSLFHPDFLIEVEGIAAVGSAGSD